MDVMFDVSRFWRRWFLEVIGMVLLGVSFVITQGFTDDSNGHLSYATQACGWLLLGLANQGATPFERAWRRLQFGFVVLIGLAVASDLLSISSPFSDVTTRRIEMAAVLALVIFVPAYLVRELLRPKSEDYRMIEAAHKEARLRERERRRIKRA